MFAYAFIRSWFTQGPVVGNINIDVRELSPLQAFSTSTTPLHVNDDSPTQLNREIRPKPTTVVQYDPAKRRPPSAMLAPVPRDNGYGDFCFESGPMRADKVNRGRNTQENASIVSTSTDPRGGLVRRYVMEDLIRLGHFQFLRLPLDVRERIYRWVAMPFNHDNERRFRVGIQRLRNRIHFLQMADNFVVNEDTFRSNPEFVRCKTREEAATRWEQRKADFHRLLAFHPGRGSDYFFFLMVKNRAGCSSKLLSISDEDEWALEWKRDIVVEALRNLSNTSTQVRDELGRLLWRRVHIDCGSFCLDQLVGFLTDRPIISPSIKFLSFSISMIPNKLKENDIESAQFPSFCKFISTNLTLGHLHIRTQCRLKDVSKIVNFEENFTFLSGLRTLKVTNNFEMCCRFVGDRKENNTLYAGSQESKYVEAYRLVEDAAMPHTLRDAELLTAEEPYLHERRISVSKTRKIIVKNKQCMVEVLDIE